MTTKALTRAVVVALMIALAAWAWGFFFPAPEKVMEKDLVKLAELVSYAPGEGNFTKLAKAEGISALLEEKVHVVVETPGQGTHTFDNREELVQAVLAARVIATGLAVKFTDIHVTVKPDGQSATAVATAEARVAGESDLVVNALRFGFEKKEGGWLISRVETVKSLQ